MTMDIQELRGKIDAIDDQLVKLFAQRMAVAAQIADYKKGRGLPVLDARREQEKLDAVAAKSGPAMAAYTRNLYETLFRLSRDYQDRLQQESALRCGLLGRKLSHSYSPQIHAKLGGYPYVLFEKEPEELEAFLRNGDFTGINVTIPYKQDVIPFLDELTDTAKALGAVNTVVRRDGRLIGHNTDYFGFQTMLRSSGLSVAGKKVLVLGSGGASKTAVAVLKQQSAHVVVISRSGKDHYGNLSQHADAALIVNTTPLGMYPDTGVTPVDLDMFPHLAGVLDIVYNPARTQLLLDAENRGLVAVNGLLMLVAQAKEAAEWFTGRPIADETVTAIHTALRKQMENIILIGMPGSGKSTVGRRISELTGKQFVDADAVIVEKAGKPIPQIFTEVGEAGFRAIETQVLAQLGKQSGLVIATGGGCVTRAENYPLLHQNGRIFCLHRDLDKLPTAGRPISQSTDAQTLYSIRKPMYDRFADYHIDCNSTIDAAAGEILKIWEEMP
jgi:shikimate dehydrogenase